MLGYIPQVKAVPESSISTIQSEQQSSVSAREELRVACCFPLEKNSALL